MRAPEMGVQEKALQTEELPPKNKAIIIIAGAMLALMLGVMDQSIVGTAGPTIISDLGGLSLYAWVFSAFIMAQAISSPIFGKLSDAYGRRKFFLSGLVVFIVGSMLSGASQSIEQLIAFRTLQGIGSGAFFTLGLAIIGASVASARRAKVLGLAASIFGLGAIMGPTAGSYLVESLGWRWIFYVNLPVGIVSLALITSSLRENSGSAKPRIDWPGVVLLAGWVSALLVGLTDGGSTYPWYSWQEASLFGSFAVLLLLFAVIEARVAEPIIPVGLFRKRTISASFAVQLIRGGALLSLAAFVSLYVQGAIGGTIDDTRNVLYAFVVPFVVGSLSAGQFLPRLGFRAVTFSGVAVLAVGAGTLAFIGPSPTVLDLMYRSVLAGFGLGFSLTSLLASFQAAVDRRQIGSATSLSTFSLTLGGAIFVSVFGSIQLNSFSMGLTSIVQQAPAQTRPLLAQLFGDSNRLGQLLTSPQALAQAEKSAPFLSSVIPQVRDALAGSLTDGFLFVFVMSVIAAGLSLLISGSPKEKAQAA
jgi:EmrB/QacA subfamily drug resistance transporter